MRTILVVEDFLWPDNDTFNQSYCFWHAAGLHTNQTKNTWELFEPVFLANFTTMYAPGLLFSSVLALFSTHFTFLLHRLCSPGQEAA